MKIGIIGAGGMGRTLARHCARLGHEVAIASPRGPHKVTAFAADAGAKAVAVEDAVRSEDLVVLAIPTKLVPELPRELFASMPSRVIVIDLGNYHPELRDGQIEPIERGLLDSQWVEQMLGHPVVKAFNNIFAKSLLEKGTPKGTPGRIALPVAADATEARSVVLSLVDALGFDPIDAGTLAESWRQATGTPAYCKDLDAPAMRRALAEAERGRVAEYRAAEEARIRRAASGTPTS